MSATWPKTIYSVYLALVCFTAGLVMCISAASVGKNMLLVAYPQLNVPAYMNPHDVMPMAKEEAARLSEAEKEEMRRAYDARQREHNLRRAQKDMIDDGFNATIALLVFAFHWVLFRRVDKQA